MATYHGTARTNFVRVKDVKAALADLEPFGNNTQVHDSVPDAIMVSGCDDTGCFSTYCVGVYKDEDGNELDIDKELDWSTWCETHLQEGQVLVLISAGAEQLRYVSAYAEAYNHRGEMVGVNLMRALDEKIKATFGDVPYADPSYDEVHDATQEGCVPDAPRA